MATAKDTSTFFLEADADHFDSVLKLYPQAIKLKAEQKTKKPEELVKLDNWYQNELPKTIKSRGKDAHMVHEELVQLMKWKQARGKFYPQLSYLIKVNTPRAVMQETKKAFKKLPNIESALAALSNLKGVGTATASALLAAASPDIAPFMADECLQAIPEMEGSDYTAKEYLNFVTHIKTVCDRLNKEQNGCGKKWSPHMVELAVWTHTIVSELQPTLLGAAPRITTLANGTSPLPSDDSNLEPPTNGNVPQDVSSGTTEEPTLTAHANGNSPLPSDDSNLEPPTNGKLSSESVTEDATTSCTEDSLDKPASPSASDNSDSALTPTTKRSAAESCSDSSQDAPCSKKSRADDH